MLPFNIEEAEELYTELPFQHRRGRTILSFPFNMEERERGTILSSPFNIEEGEELYTELPF